jgi:hypothetical protein
MSEREDKLAAWVRAEQIALWDQLDSAIRHAANTVWSIECEWAASRIVYAAHLVGPVPHGEVPWRMLAGGLYAELYALAGIPTAGIDETEWEELDELMHKHGGRLRALRIWGGPTRVAMRKAWPRILEGADDE